MIENCNLYFPFFTCSYKVKNMNQNRVNHQEQRHGTQNVMDDDRPPPLTDNQS